MISNKQQQIIDIMVFQVCRPTDRAICVSLIEKRSPGHKAVWLPKSLIEYREVGTDQYEISVPQWLAERENLV